MDPQQIPPELSDLIFFALDHGVDSVRTSGGPLVPFVVHAASARTNKKLARFAAEQLELGVESARRYASNLSEAEAKYCVIAYDGFLTVQGKRWDAVFVEASEQGQQGVVLAQRYKPKKFLQKFQTVGNAAFLGDAESLF